jgi:hypothetical protein
MITASPLLEIDSQSIVASSKQSEPAKHPAVGSWSDGDGGFLVADIGFYERGMKHAEPS